MIGVRIEIFRDDKPETVYLSTVRTGMEGEAIATAKRECRAAKLAQAQMLPRVAFVTDKAERVPKDAPDRTEQLGALASEQDALIELLGAAQDREERAALAVTRLALEANYGAKEAARILDCMTDRQIGQCVGILETGETPADFFPSRATRPSGNGLTPGAGGSTGSS